MSERESFVSWVHFGDLHIRHREDENYQDFLQLIEAANQNLAGQVDFAYLPGDNADDGTEAQYELVREALSRLQLPVQSITGDHDRKTGTLEPYRQFLASDPYRAVTVRDFRLLYLNAMDGADHKQFDLGPEQFEWLTKELVKARETGLRAVVFVHVYPHDLSSKGEELSRLIQREGVELVEMGHTHYNELANDGRVLYAAARSTGQIEEGPPGFSLTVIEDDVISWKFKPRGPWPFVMITAPADHRLITRPESSGHVVRGIVSIRARAWDGRAIYSIACRIDGGERRPMQQTDSGAWQCSWDTRLQPDGCHTIRAEAISGESPAEDEITVLVSQSGAYTAPARAAIDYENVLGSWPEKGILGTQLGPNENGTKGPWPSWRDR